MIASAILLQILKGSSPLIGAGSCSISDYKGWLLLSGLGFAISDDSGTSGTPSSGDSDDGPTKDVPSASPQSIQVTKALDQSSVYLMHLAAQDRSTKEADIDNRKAKIIFLENKNFGSKDTRSDKLYPTVQFLLGSVKIEDWSMDGSTADEPTENFTLSFKQFSMVYAGQEIGTTSVTRYGPKSWDETKRGDWSDGNSKWYIR